MSKIDHFQQKRLNLADELRETLSSLEDRQVKIKSMNSAKAFTLLRDLDQVYLLFQQLESIDLNLLSERGRFEAVQARLEKSAGPLLKALGGPTALSEHRPSPAPPRERWWWYIHELVAERQRRLWRRTIISAVIILLIVGLAVLAFKTVLAPAPEVAARIDAENAAFLAIDEGNYSSALDAVETGLAKVPDEPNLLLLKGVLQELLGQKAAATQSFDQAGTILNDPLAYHLGRSQLELRLNQLEKAEQDAKTALEIDENSASAWLMLGQAFELQGKTLEAIQAYQKASELGFETGDNQVVVLARLALARLGGR